ncbi:MAG: hypothetical protein QOJ40_244 [Verrucomicrobiota bacterium]
MTTKVFAHFKVGIRGPTLGPIVEPVLTNKTMPERAAYASIGIIAWNEEAGIASTIESLFRQSIFAELSKRGLKCEVICVANGCSDRTAVIAAECFKDQKAKHPFSDSIIGRVANLTERGKTNAWNQFVHSLSAKESQFLFLMDADILIHKHDTLRNMLACLENEPGAKVSVDRPRKDVAFKRRKSVWDHLSLMAAETTSSAQAQLCGQLYCIRAEVARNIYLPKNLGSCEDGFIKILVCTNFLSEPVAPERIRVAEEAEHTFEAYTSPTAVFKNQKRQVIGQTILHLLVDNHLKHLPMAARLGLGETIKEKEAADPSWLKRLIADHVRRTRYFWRLYPDLLSIRFKRLKGLRPLKRVAYFPVAAAGFLISLGACWKAHQTLKQGSIDYWPGKSQGARPVEQETTPLWKMPATNPNSK